MGIWVEFWSHYLIALCFFVGGVNFHSKPLILYLKNGDDTDNTYYSVQFGCLGVSNSLRPDGLQHARTPCPLLTPGIYSYSSFSVQPQQPQSGDVPALLLSSVQFSRSVVSDSLRPHGLQHARLPCPSPTSRVYSNSCPLSQ